MCFKFKLKCVCERAFKHLQKIESELKVCHRFRISKGDDMRFPNPERIFLELTCCKSSKPPGSLFSVHTHEAKPLGVMRRCHPSFTQPSL